MAEDPPKALGNVLVIGGCGFLGSHIVDHLLSSSSTSSITVLSRSCSKAPGKLPGVNYIDGDITKLQSVLPLFQKSKFNVVFHTVSPPATTSTEKQFQVVNIKGTQNIIQAAKETGVKALVYTSSGAVIQGDFRTRYENVDETWPVIRGPDQKDPYSRTKAEAETLVLAANRAGASLLTCSIRGQGLFGERDNNVFPQIIKIYRDKSTGIQIGDNQNPFDFVYVSNIASAHLLASSALLKAHEATQSIPADMKVEGEAFFVTNEEPVPFWTFSRMIWKGMGDEKNYEKVFVLSQKAALIAAKIVSIPFNFLGKTSPFTEKIVLYCCMTAYFNNKKAETRLGYKVKVSLKEGIEKTCKVCCRSEN
ncbi:NAD(P)-binding protein [Stipitochalara longipes BDJ]|nr:NAD(P)-binding protein [Stipitochalara longipes BDJ]